MAPPGFGPGFDPDEYHGHPTTAPSKEATSPNIIGRQTSPGFGQERQEMSLFLPIQPSSQPEESDKAHISKPQPAFPNHLQHLNHQPRSYRTNSGVHKSATRLSERHASPSEIASSPIQQISKNGQVNVRPANPRPDYMAPFPFAPVPPSQSHVTPPSQRPGLPISAGQASSSSQATPPVPDTLHCIPDPPNSNSVSVSNDRILHSPSSFSIVLSSPKVASISGPHSLSQPSATSSRPQGPASKTASTPSDGRTLEDNEASATPSPESFEEATASNDPTAPGPKRRGRPAKSKGKTTQATAPKKRGRPFRTAESEAKAKERAAEKASGVVKKPGRPPGTTRHKVIEGPDPLFYPFKCEWKGCVAELQNLETLVIHVFNVHIPKRARAQAYEKSQAERDKGYACMWGKCCIERETILDIEESEELAKYLCVRFKSRKEWKNHMKERHFIPLAWHMGDGPKGSTLLMKKPDISALWLDDANGNQVTPSVKDQVIEHGSMKFNNARRYKKIKRRLAATQFQAIMEPVINPQRYMRVRRNTSSEDDGVQGGDESGSSPAADTAVDTPGEGASPGGSASDGEDVMMSGAL